MSVVGKSSTERDLVPWLESKLATTSNGGNGGTYSLSNYDSKMTHSSIDPLTSADLQKMVTSSGLWGSRSANAFLNPELLTEIQSCFVDLQVPTKLKLLLALLHLSKRNIDQWKSEVEDVLSLASQDIDEWVQTVADLLKDFPTTAGFSFNMNSDDSQFTKSLQSLRKILKKQVKEASQVLPLDAAFVNKNSLQNIWGTTVNLPKHFTLKRKTKAAAQRVELLQKSHDAPNQKNKAGFVSSIVPIKARDTVRKMDTNSPLRGIPSQNPSKLSSGFTTSKMYNRPVITKKEGGAKLIDIAETPEMLKKRKKEMEVEEKAAKKALKEELKRKREQEREEAKERRKARLSESYPELEPEAVALEPEEDLSEPTAAAQIFGHSEIARPPPSYVADLLEATLPAMPAAATVEESPKSTNPSANATTAIAAGATSSETEGFLSSPKIQKQFPQVPPVSVEPIDFARASIIPPQPLSTQSILATTISSSSQLPIITTTMISNNSLYNSQASYAAQMVHSYAINPNFAAAFASRTISSAHSTSANNPTKFVRQAATLRGPTQIANPFPYSSTASVLQHHQQPMIRLNALGHPQTVIVQNTANAAAANARQQQSSTVFIMPSSQAAGQSMVKPTAPSFFAAAGVNALRLVAPASAASSYSSTQPRSTDFYVSTTTRSSLQSTVSTPMNTKRVVDNILMDHNQAAKVQPSPGSGGVNINNNLGGGSVVGSGSAFNSPSSTGSNAVASTSSSPCYTITKDVMLEAQDIFKTANKLTRPEKALILGFMAGNRENPCPQMGSVLTVRLSEDVENIVSQKDGSVQRIINEIYFQMNYETGEWKKLRKTRPGN